MATPDVDANHSHNSFCSKIKRFLCYKIVCPHRPIYCYQICTLDTIIVKVLLLWSLLAGELCLDLKCMLKGEPMTSITDHCPDSYTIYNSMKDTFGGTSKALSLHSEDVALLMCCICLKMYYMHIHHDFHLAGDFSLKPLIKSLMPLNGLESQRYSGNMAHSGTTFKDHSGKSKRLLGAHLG